MEIVKVYAPDGTLLGAVVEGVFYERRENVYPRIERGRGK